MRIRKVHTDMIEITLMDDDEIRRIMSALIIAHKNIKSEPTRALLKQVISHLEYNDDAN